VLLGLGRADAGPHTAPKRYRHYGQSGRFKVAGIRHAIEAYGAELHYLPPYSPDFNPIENAFAKLKAHVRKSAARTLDAHERAAAMPCNSSNLTNAQTSSATPDMAWIKRNLL
jgi:transposase